MDIKTERTLLRYGNQHISQFKGYISKDKKQTKGLLHCSEVHWYVKRLIVKILYLFAISSLSS